LSAGITERFADSLLARVASADVPVPFAPILEDAYRPDANRIIEATKQIMAF
jgi:pyruvate/2-oxoglutarate/acetoin dehydrogenase E1 component